MGVHIGYSKLVIITEPKTFHFDLPKDVDKNLKYEIDLIIKHNECLGEHTIKNEISQLLLKYKHGNNIHEHRKQYHTSTTQICSEQIITRGKI